MRNIYSVMIKSKVKYIADKFITAIWANNVEEATILGKAELIKRGYSDLLDQMYIN